MWDFFIFLLVLVCVFVYLFVCFCCCFGVSYGFCKRPGKKIGEEKNG